MKVDRCGVGCGGVRRWVDSCVAVQADWASLYSAYAGARARYRRTGFVPVHGVRFALMECSACGIFRSVARLIPTTACACCFHRKAVRVSLALAHLHACIRNSLTLTHLHACVLFHILFIYLFKYSNIFKCYVLLSLGIVKTWFLRVITSCS